MRIRLSNYGQRYISVRLKSPAFQGPEIRTLERLERSLSLPYTAAASEKEWLERGLIELIPDDVRDEDIALRYKRNPLENVEIINFEMTTRCNLHCLHCRSGIARRHTETDIEALKAAAERFLDLGIRRFIFIGGEVSKYGYGWLELVQHIHQYDHANQAHIPGSATRKLEIAVLTSGWWLDQSDFEAAGRVYETTTAYLQALRESGLTHIIFSIDGPEELHDVWRQTPGLYRRIMRGIPQVHAAGLTPRLSLVISTSEHERLGYDYLAEIADLLYDFPPNVDQIKRITTLLTDPANWVSNFIDINRGAQLREGRFHLAEIDPALLRCKAFYRPAPKLTIAASGEIAICPLMNAAEKYGNIHEKGLVNVLNTLDENLIFQLHAERRIEAYLPLMDVSIFGERFDHVCSLRVILNLLALGMKEQGLSPDSITKADEPILARINRDVARWTGHRESVRK